MTEANSGILMNVEPVYMSTVRSGVGTNDIFYLVCLHCDCYFTLSPVVDGMQIYEVEGPGGASTAKAKRVMHLGPVGAHC